MVTDGTRSYAIFSYGCGNVNHGNDAVVGFRATERFAEYHPLSFGNATKIGCAGSGEFNLLLFDLTPDTSPTGEWPKYVHSRQDSPAQICGGLIMIAVSYSPQWADCSSSLVQWFSTVTTLANNIIYLWYRSEM